MSSSRVSPNGSTQSSYDSANEPKNWQELEKKTGMNIIKGSERAWKELMQDSDNNCFELDQDSDEN